MNTTSTQALDQLNQQILKENRDHELKTHELRSLIQEETRMQQKLNEAQKAFDAAKAKADSKRREIEQLETMRSHNQQEMQRMERELHSLMNKK